MMHRSANVWRSMVDRPPAPHHDKHIAARMELRAEGTAGEFRQIQAKLQTTAVSRFGTK
jgi:hypothetical protein